MSKKKQRSYPKGSLLWHRQQAGKIGGRVKNPNKGFGSKKPDKNGLAGSERAKKAGSAPKKRDIIIKDRKG